MTERTESNSFILILTSTPNENEALNIVQILLEKKLIACGKILKDVTSRYWWQGKIEEAREFIVILKTCQERFKEIHETIQRVHSYQVPELIAIPILDGAPSYLAWLKDAVTP